MASLRVGYLSDVDPRDRWAWSGGHYFMGRSLAARGFEIVHIGRSLIQKRGPFEKVVNKLGLKRGSPSEEGETVVERAAREVAMIDDELLQQRCDVLFAPLASRLVGFLQTNLPIAYLSDATFRILRGYYREITDLSDSVAADREYVEGRSLRRSDLAVFPSHWAADSAVSHYGVAPERVRVLPLGANLDVVPPAARVMGRERDPICRLLFIGRDWERKGGEVALAAHRRLMDFGIASELTICGSKPPPGADLECVEIFENLDKRKARDREKLHRLLMRSDFLILPTRAECFGVVCCEANAYGIPVLGTDTGGMPIKDGLNGYRFSLDSGGGEYAAAIRDLWSDEEKHRNLRRTSRRMFDEHLNWDSWGAAMATELTRLAGSRRVPMRSFA